MVWPSLGHSRVGTLGENRAPVAHRAALVDAARGPNPVATFTNLNIIPPKATLIRLGRDKDSPPKHLGET